MPSFEFVPQIREEFASTRYPFTDTATLTSTDRLSLPLGLFLDASLYPLGAQDRLFISAITLAARLVTLTLSDATPRALATVSFDPLLPPDILRFTDSYGRPAGILVCSDPLLAQFSAWPLGVHTFTAAATEFATNCVIPLPATGVRGILTLKGELLTEDVWLVGDNGVLIREEDGCIRIDAVGDPLFVRKLCQPARRFQSERFLQTINGCGPDLHGNYNLTVGSHYNPETIVRIYSAGSSLIIGAVGSTLMEHT